MLARFSRSGSQNHPPPLKILDPPMHCTRIVSLFHAAGSLTLAGRLANVSVMYL